MDIRETDEFKSGDFHIVTCPVCRNETLDNYWICAHCGWEYDGTHDEDARSAANGMSIRQYRAIYPEKVKAQTGSETSAVQESILELLESPELRTYLLANPERLRPTDYASIIAGAPIDLVKKKALLLRLARVCGNAVDAYITAVDDALAALFEKDGTQGVLSLILRNGNSFENIDDFFFDGPYYAATVEAAQKAIRQYQEELDYDNPKCLYWEIKLLRKDAPTGYCDFLLPAYTYIADRNGEIQYFQKGRTSPLSTAFGEYVVDLNLPVPYRPGDILEIDCSPYTGGPRYCRLTEVGDDCCGIWCVYPDADGRLGCGALKHGHYFASAYSLPQYLSPLYRAKVYTGKLPKEYAILHTTEETWTFSDI